MAKSPIGSPEAAANGKAALARTARCIYCNATSTKDSRTSPAGPWCHIHRPGPRKKSSSTVDRLGGATGPTGKKPPPPRTIGQVAGLREGMLGLMLPPAMLTWPPCARIMADKKPGQRIDVGLRHIAWALIGEALGACSWSHCRELLEAHGYLLPGDPPLPKIEPGAWDMVAHRLARQQHVTKDLSP